MVENGGSNNTIPCEPLPLRWNDFINLVLGFCLGVTFSMIILV